MKKLLFIGLFLLPFYLSAQQEQGPTTPSKTPNFGLKSNDIGIASSSVNLVTGDVHLPISLVNLTKHNGLGIDVGIKYSSNIECYIKSFWAIY